MTTYGIGIEQMPAFAAQFSRAKERLSEASVRTRQPLRQ
jgi:hypothetical protein